MHVCRCMWPNFKHIVFAGDFEYAAEEDKCPCRYTTEYTDILFTAHFCHDLYLLVPFGQQAGFDRGREKWSSYPWHMLKHDGGDIAVSNFRMRHAGDTSGQHQILIREDTCIGMAVIQ